ncbi:MAG: hypothetical protein KAH57_03495 [Thermoplasmata archaeon]|nr:hypothetical protein [Thermoplasmata archaeon]
MKLYPFVITILLTILTIGCLESVDEMLDPDLTIAVEDTWTQNETDDNLLPLSDHEWFYININITNNNEEGSHPIDVNQFFAKIGDDWLWCRGPPGGETMIDPDESLILTIYFEVEVGERPTELEYRRTVSDPISCPIQPNFNMTSID